MAEMFSIDWRGTPLALDCDARAAERGYCSRRDFLAGSTAGMLLAGLGARSSSAMQLRDPYGGCLTSSLIADRALGRFRVQKIGRRWLFVTPAGHPYWMLGVFDVDTSSAEFAPGHSYRSAALAKYGDEVVWARQAVRRLRTWGFNCLAEYAGDYTLPVALYGRAGNRERMPFMAMIRPAAFSLTNRWGYAAAPVADVVAATDPAVYTGWRGSLPDVFDPCFASYAKAEAEALARQLGHSDFLAGVATDDTDDLFGFGPGPDVPAARTHPHIGWLVLAANPHPAGALHSKWVLQHWLQQRYASIAALNLAWQSSYASFGSEGGWPHGRGLLDESGRNRWLGDCDRMATASPALRADLDAFLYDFARTYFGSVTAAVRGAFPGYLVFGPATLNAWNGLTREPILRAAGEAMDVLQANTATPEILDRTIAAAGDKPIVTWTGIAANSDSDLEAFADPANGSPQCNTQSDRGAYYRDAAIRQFTAGTSTHPIVGTKFWSFTDSWAEKMNWGLVSFRDNAYDGLEARRAHGRDAWGYAIGGEDRDYGDCLHSITAANAALYRRLQAEFDPNPGRAIGSSD